MKPAIGIVVALLVGVAMERLLDPSLLASSIAIVALPPMYVVAIWRLSRVASIPPTSAEDDVSARSSDGEAST